MGVHIPVRKRVIGSASLLHKPVWGDVERTYAQKVLALGPIAYWPLWESSGTVAHCLVNTAQNGTYSSDVSTWPVGTGIGDGNTAPQFDAANDYIDVHTATVAAAFNGVEGTLFQWIRADAGSWTDGTRRICFYAPVDGNNYVLIDQSNGANTFRYIYSAGAVLEIVSRASTETDWYAIAATWSKAADAFKAYWGGAQTGATQTVLGNWAGAPIQAWIGALDNGPNNPWDGRIAHTAIWDRVLSLSEIADLSVV